MFSSSFQFVEYALHVQQYSQQTQGLLFSSEAYEIIKGNIKWHKDEDI